VAYFFAFCALKEITGATTDVLNEDGIEWLKTSTGCSWPDHTTAHSGGFWQL